MTMTTCSCERNYLPPSSAMTRSRSWPMLFTVPEEETAVSGGCGPSVAAASPAVGQPQRPENVVADGTVLRQPQQHVMAPAANVGRLLRRHYYPEAGWGWVVVTCACMVHVLNHGLQLSFGALERDTIQRFRDVTYHGTGMLQYGRNISVTNSPTGN